jgi:hypothetical protein
MVAVAAASSCVATHNSGRSYTSNTENMFWPRTDIAAGLRTEQVQMGIPSFWKYLSVQ